MTYEFKCGQHPEPVTFEKEARITDFTPTSAPCPECGKAAGRLWAGQKFYATVPGAHGGGPATR